MLEHVYVEELEDSLRWVFFLDIRGDGMTVLGLEASAVGLGILCLLCDLGTLLAYVSFFPVGNAGYLVLSASSMNLMRIRHLIACHRTQRERAAQRRRRRT